MKLWRQVSRGLHRRDTLEEENVQRKRQVADLTLDRAMLRDALRRKWRSPLFTAKSRAIFVRPTVSASGWPAKRLASCDRASATEFGAIRRQRCATGLKELTAAHVAPGLSEGACPYSSQPFLLAKVRA